MLDAAYALARELIERTAPISVAVMRQMLFHLSALDSPEPSFALESKLIASCGANPDSLEGVVSFLRAAPAGVHWRDQQGPAGFPAVGARVSSAESESPRWRRLEPDARREQILDCAVRLFGERPYSAVSTTEIAREAGVARGLLNHYFGTKRELYLDVVRRMVIMPDLFDTVTSGSIDERVEQSVTWFLDTVGPYGKTFVAVIGAEGVGTDSEVEAILAEADDIAAARVLATVGVPEDADGAQQGDDPRVRRNGEGGDPGMGARRHAHPRSGRVAPQPGSDHDHP